MTIFEPPAAIAAARCVVSRTRPDRRGAPIDPEHPRECAWCPFPTDELVRAVEGFNAWAGWDERSRTHERHDVRLFAELPRERQHQLVVEAQEFVPPPPEPVAVQAPTNPPAVVQPPAEPDPPSPPAVEAPSWLVSRP